MSTRRTFLGRAFGACSALFAARGLSGADADANADAAGNTQSRASPRCPTAQPCRRRIHRCPRQW